MADNDQKNDEYQFVDLDNPEGSGDMPSDESSAESSFEPFHPPESHTRRNALLVFLVVGLLMLAYKFIGPYFIGKKELAQPVPAVVPQPTPVTTPLPTQALPTEIQPIPAPTADASGVNQKLSALEVNQQNMQSNISSVNNQLTGIGQSVSELSNKIEQLNNVIAALNDKLAVQSHQIELLTIKSKPKPVKRIIHVTPGVQYYIQAVIPGRAWLISTKGTNLTVREGTLLPGYGVVKLIDANQGRVVTSTGQVIRFSQADS